MKNKGLCKILPIVLKSINLFIKPPTFHINAGGIVLNIFISMYQKQLLFHPSIFSLECLQTVSLYFVFIGSFLQHPSKYFLHLSQSNCSYFIIVSYGYTILPHIKFCSSNYKNITKLGIISNIFLIAYGFVCLQFGQDIAFQVLWWCQLRSYGGTPLADGLVLRIQDGCTTFQRAVPEVIGRLFSLGLLAGIPTWSNKAWWSQCCTISNAYGEPKGIPVAGY